MKAKINQNGREVEIDLTPEQIEIVKSAKFGDYRDITTFEEACEAVGIKWEEPIGLPVDVIAYMKLRIIAKALNGGSWMTYKDTDEGKYYPYFNASGSAAGFSYDVCTYVRSGSFVGSRLTFKTADIAKYAGTQFLEIYNQYIN
jgi:hypothetical protein